jgi:hypothetical protein
MMDYKIKSNMIESNMIESNMIDFQHIAAPQRHDGPRHVARDTWSMLQPCSNTLNTSKPLRSMTLNMFCPPIKPTELPFNDK